MWHVHHTGYDYRNTRALKRAHNKLESCFASGTTIIDAVLENESTLSGQEVL